MLTVGNNMRLAVVLLLLACLVVRWADAACGCPQHNGWATLVAEVVGSAEHADHGSHAPAYGHACCSEGRATYTGGARVIVSDASGLPPAFVSPDPTVSVTRGLGEVGWRQLDRPPLTRAALQVWRI